MPSIVRTCCAALTLIAALGSGSVLAASNATVQIQPTKLTVGHSATIVGSHLPARHSFSLELAVGSASNPKARALVPVVLRSDKNGSLKASFLVPPMTACGSAILYVIPVKSKTALQARVSVTGCSAKKGSGLKPPAPPPTPAKKHK